MTRAVAEAPGRVKSLTWGHDDEARANGYTYRLVSTAGRGAPPDWHPLVRYDSTSKLRRLDDRRHDYPLAQPDHYDYSKAAARRYAALHARVVYLTEMREEQWKDMRGAHSGHYLCSWCGEAKHCRGLTRSRMSCHDCYIKKGSPVLTRKGETADA